MYWNNIVVINDSSQWECQERFDSLGRRSAGMHKPSLFRDRSSVDIKRYRVVVSQATQQEHSLRACGQFLETVLPTANGDPSWAKHGFRDTADGHGHT